MTTPIGPMSPLEFVQWLAADMQASYPGLFPQPFLCQLGDLVIDCPGTFLSGLTLSQQSPWRNDLPGSNCDMVQMLDIVVAVARECGFVADEQDGLTDHAKMGEVSALMDADAVALKEWADKKYLESWFRLGMPTVTFLLLGGLAITTLNLSLTVP